MNNLINILQAMWKFSINNLEKLNHIAGIIVAIFVVVGYFSTIKPAFDKQKLLNQIEDLEAKKDQLEEESEEYTFIESYSRFADRLLTNDYFKNSRDSSFYHALLDENNIDTIEDALLREYKEIYSHLFDLVANIATNPKEKKLFASYSSIAQDFLRSKELVEIKDYSRFKYTIEWYYLQKEKQIKVSDKHLEDNPISTDYASFLTWRRLETGINHLTIEMTSILILFLRFNCYNSLVLDVLKAIENTNPELFSTESVYPDYYDEIVRDIYLSESKILEWFYLSPKPNGGTVNWNMDEGTRIGSPDN